MISSAAMKDAKTARACHIRDEAPGDAAAIAAVIAAAFGEPPEGQPAEVQLVAALRAAGALSLSLVAEESDVGIVGHIAFSPVTVDGRGADRLLGLAPLAVVPARQGRGIGRSLVEAGLARARLAGAALAFVLGEPAYYRRFGFRPAANWDIAWQHAAPAEAFMAVELRPGAGVAWQGILRYHPAFDIFSE